MSCQKTPYYLILITAVTLLCACKKNFSSGQFEDDQLVVLAEITANDSVHIPIGKTLKVGSGSLIRFEKVNDATVVLVENDQKSWILKPNFSPLYFNDPTSVFTSRKRFVPGMPYSLTIQHPTMGHVYAETYIPALPKLIAVDTAREQF